MRMRFRAAVVAATALGFVGGGWIGAQEPAAPTAKPVDLAVKRKHDPARRVPAYFGQIGLTTEQRAPLPETQRKLLDNRRGASNEPGATRTAVAATPGH